MLSAVLLAPAVAAPTPPPQAGQPQILGVELSPRNVHTGVQVSARVRTTLEVDRVEAKLPGRSMQLDRIGPGLFAGSIRLPWLPPFVRGARDVTFVARTAAGRWTQSAVSVTVY